MRILIVDTYYPAAVDALGFGGRGPLPDGYESGSSRLLSSGFGTGASYARGLNAQGVRTDVVVPNARALQETWALENDLRPLIPAGWGYGIHIARLPLVRDHLWRFPHLHYVLLEQIKAKRPDVVLVQDINLIPLSLAKAIKRLGTYLVGEIASPLPPKTYFKGYDLIVSALPSIVEQVRDWGLPSAYLPLGFDPAWSVLSPASSREIDAVFVGSFSRHQPQTIPLLQAVARVNPGFQIYGPVSPEDLKAAGLESFYKGQAWGKAMFDILGNSKIVVNRHGTIAGDYAVNMRMYESTGMGAVLVTENKSNLSRLFEPGREVIAYESAHGAAHSVQELLRSPSQLDDIARQGQQKTLREHTYTNRASQLVDIINSERR